MMVIVKKSKLLKSNHSSSWLVQDRIRFWMRSDSSDLTRKTQESVIDKHWPKVFWGLFIVFGFITVAGLFSALPHRTHDNDYEVWLNAFDQLIKAGQWFPSWVKDFWFQHGSAQFIAYPPLFFYLAEIPRLLGLNLVFSVKIIVGLSLLAAFFSMYLLGRELAGPKAPLRGKRAGLIAGLLYLTFPYHLALVYIRGAYAENLAYALAPLAFYFIYRMWHRPARWDVIGLGAVIAALILTNIPSLLLLAVAGLLWIGLWWWREGLVPWRQLLSGGAVGLGLSAWWWYPMMLSRPLLQIEYFVSGPFSFTKYLTTLVDYLPSLVWSGARYFQWGIVAWLVIVGALIYLWRARRQRETGQRQLIWLLLAKLVLITALMTAVSYPLWRYLPDFTYIQFPYRFLMAAGLVVALLGALLLSGLKWRWQAALLALLFLQTLFFARPIGGWRSAPYAGDLAYSVYSDINVQLNDSKAETDLTGNRIVLLHTAETAFLPQGIDRAVFEQEYYDKLLPALRPLSLAEAAAYSIPAEQKIMTSGKISDVSDDVRSISFTHQADDAVQVFYRELAFPGWRVWIDDQPADWSSSSGQLDFIVLSGTHRVRIAYANPPGAVAGRVVSLLALLGLLWVLWCPRLRGKSPHPTRIVSSRPV